MTDERGRRPTSGPSSGNEIERRVKELADRIDDKLNQLQQLIMEERKEDGSR